MEIKNANPTILNVSDLPTRKLTTTSRTRSPIDDVVPVSTTDPFAPDAESDSGDDSDLEIESIDAQEIYDLVSTMCDP